jgi:hypothetical protein
MMANRQSFCLPEPGKIPTGRERGRSFFLSNLSGDFRVADSDPPPATDWKEKAIW